MDSLIFPRCANVTNVGNRFLSRTWNAILKIANESSSTLLRMLKPPKSSSFKQWRADIRWARAILLNMLAGSHVLPLQSLLFVWTAKMMTLVQLKSKKSPSGSRKVNKFEDRLEIPQAKMQINNTRQAVQLIPNFKRLWTIESNVHIVHECFLTMLRKDTSQSVKEMRNQANWWLWETTVPWLLGQKLRTLPQHILA